MASQRKGFYLFMVVLLLVELDPSHGSPLTNGPCTEYATTTVKYMAKHCEIYDMAWKECVEMQKTWLSTRAANPNAEVVPGCTVKNMLKVALEIISDQQSKACSASE